MKSLVTLCVNNPVFVNILLVIILLAGGYNAATLVREVFPNFSIDLIHVGVPYPGAGPEEVEEGIALKLEDAIEGIENVKTYYTVSAENVGMAYIEVVEGADLEVVKDDVTNEINTITQFPDDAERPTIREVKFDESVLWIALYGDLPERQLKELAEDIKDELILEPGISKVAVDGARAYEIAIEVSEDRLRQYGLTFDEVSNAVRQAGENWSGGTVRAANEQIKIRTMGRRYRGADYGGIILISRADGTSIRLDQVATIRDGFEEDQRIGRFDGYPTVQIQVFKTESEDALKISAQVDEYLARKSKLLPPTVQMKKWADSSKFIESRQSLLVKNGMIGLVLVFFLLWFFLDLRLAFWVSLGIPISLAGAMALMGAVGQTVNMISLFALIMILGIIVDDAIIIGESIYHHRKKGTPPRKAAIGGTLEVAWPVFAAVVTTVIAFIPLMFVGGIMGKFIFVLPVVVIAALMMSLVESLLLLPTHLLALPYVDPEQAKTATGFKGKSQRLRIYMSNLIQRFASSVYRPFIETALHWRYVTLAIAIAVFLLTIGMIQGGHLKYVMFPKTDSDFMIANLEFAEGTPLKVTEAGIDQLVNTLRRIEQEYAEEDGREALTTGVYSIVGSSFSDTGDMNYGDHVGGVLVELVPSENRNLHYRTLMDRWEKETGEIPGAESLEFLEFEGGPPGKPIEVRLLGRDMDQLLKVSEELKEKLKTYNGAFQVQDDFSAGKRELRAYLKPEARTLGLTTQALGRQLRQGFYGDEVMRIQRGRDEVKVWVRYPEEERNSLSNMDAIRIRTPQGAEVPLNSVANLSLEEGYSTIRREDGMRRVTVSADVDTKVGNTQEITKDITENFLPELKSRYPGIDTKIEGEKQKSSESLGSLKIGFPLAMLGIYLVLATMFRSYITPLVIMITIPFGLIGASLSHRLMGLNLTIMSMFGMVALAGIVVNDAIVMIDAVDERLRRGMKLFEALAAAGQRRFRAIMLTTLTTSAGLTPIILEKNVQAQFLIPMALTIAAGVMFATVLTLVLIPCLLLILNDLRRGVRYLLSPDKTLPTREEVEPVVRRMNGNAKHEALETGEASG